MDLIHKAFKAYKTASNPSNSLRKPSNKKKLVLMKLSVVQGFMNVFNVKFRGRVGRLRERDIIYLSVGIENIDGYVHIDGGGSGPRGSEL